MADYIEIDYSKFAEAAPEGAAPAVGMIEHLSSAILNFDWLGHWRIIAGILIGIWVVKVLLHREKLKWCLL